MKPIDHKSELAKARNIGSGIAYSLAGVGIKSLSELAEVGPVSAYRRMSAERSGEHLPVCFYLYSLKGALENRDWRSLSEHEKQAMRKQAGLA